jgi:hypothetical protein
MTAATIGIVLLLTQSAAVPEPTIRGTILSPDGQAAPEIEIVALAVGTDRLVGRAAISDTEGKFSITAVPPGQVILRAQPRIRFVAGKRLPPVNSPPAYFPGVLDRLDAWPIDVKPGEIIELDFHMPPIFIGSIKTIVSGPEGYVLERVRVLRPEANQIKNVTVSDDGVGYVDSLREGRYAVAARARSRDALLAAHQIVHITGGEVTVTLSLEPTARVNGRVIVERGGLPPIDNTRVVAAWTDGTIDLDPLGRDEAHVGPDGSFTIDGLFGTRSFRLAGLRADWQVVAIRQGRSDITSSGIDLVPGSATEIAIVVAKR